MVKKSSEAVTSRIRQEVLNVYLAELLQERGLIALPEQIQVRERARQMPDVVVDFRGLRLVIEGEFAAPHAKKRAGEAVLRRIERGVAHLGIAVVYPVSLRAIRFRKELAESKFEFAVITETQPAEAQQLPLIYAREENHFKFVSGSLNDLVEVLHQSYNQLIRDTVLQRAVDLVGEGIGHLVNALTGQPAVPERFAGALEVGEVSSSNSNEEDA